MSPPSKVTSRSSRLGDDDTVETNVDVEKLRSAQREHRLKLIVEWAQRLAGRYPDPEALKSQLAGLFEDLNDYLSDEDIGRLCGLVEAGLQEDDSPKPGAPLQDIQSSRPAAPDREPQAQNVVETEKEAAMDPRLATAELQTDEPADTTSGLPAGGGIGRLVSVSPSEVWRTSHFDISDWLVDNPDVAKDVLGFELRKIPGGFSGGRPSIEDSSGRTVLIVSQLSEISHDSLGEFVSRMASSRAKIGIWVVTGSRQEDVNAIGWLNGLGASIFLIKLEAVRIANSPPAPLLTLITISRSGN